MFLRFRNRKLTLWADTCLEVRLVENTSINAKTHQRVIKYLGSIRERRMDNPRWTTAFWRKVFRGLDGLGMSESQRREFVEKILERVPASEEMEEGRT